MSNIDISMLIGAQERREITAQALKKELKGICRARILDVAGPLAQTNLAASSAAGKMTEDDTAAYGQFLDWVTSMRAVCHDAVDVSGGMLKDTTIWPALPAAVADLLRRF